MTSLRGLWQDCAEWDRRYRDEIERTNMRSVGPPRPGSLLADNRSGDGAAGNDPSPGQHPDKEGSA